MIRNHFNEKWYKNQTSRFLADLLGNDHHRLAFQVVLRPGYKTPYPYVGWPPYESNKATVGYTATARGVMEPRLAWYWFVWQDTAYQPSYAFKGSRGGGTVLSFTELIDSVQNDLRRGH